MNLGYVFLVGAAAAVLTAAWSRPSWLGLRQAVSSHARPPEASCEASSRSAQRLSRPRAPLHATQLSQHLSCTQAMGAYFDRDTVALPGISKFFRVSVSCNVMLRFLCPYHFEQARLLCTATETAHAACRTNGRQAPSLRSSFCPGNAVHERARVWRR